MSKAGIAELSKIDIYAEGREVWRIFDGMLAKMPGYYALKRNPNFEHLSEAQDGTNIYTYFPFLFSETFPELDLKTLRKLSLIGLLYTYHITLADELIDNENGLPLESILVSNACSMKAVEILSEVFGNRQIPWSRISRFHRRYGIAVALERQRHYKKIERYAARDAIAILSGRCAMAKLIPLAMCSLTGREKLLKPLCRSFDLYYAAEQMVDDFRDWKQDLNAGRYTYLLTDLIAGSDLQTRIDGVDSGQVFDLVGKYFYLSGRAEHYLAQAIDYCERARQCVDTISCPRWHVFLDSFQMRIHVSRSNMAKRCRTVLLQSDKYNYTLKQPDRFLIDKALSSGVAHPVAAVAPTLCQAATRAAEFLAEHYKPGKGFEDFLMSRGQLPNWVSGYVGVALFEWHKQSVKHVSTDETLGLTLKKLAADLLAKQRAYGWPCGDLTPIDQIGEDGDTTAWVLDLLLSMNNVDTEAIERGINSLVQYQLSDGGFCTYLPQAAGPEAVGFTSSHVEVTAFVLQVLLKAGFAPDSPVINRGLDFINGRQEPNGMWEAYWWDGQMYSTYHCLAAIDASGREISQELRDRLVLEILSYQDENGSWGLQTLGKNEAFETALAIKTLLLLESSMAESDQVRKALVNLLNYQNGDGGFNSAPMVRVPEVCEKEPWRIKDWKLDLATGFGIIARDQNRLFTTATVLSALSDVLACAGDLEMKTELRQSSRALEPELVAAV